MKRSFRDVLKLHLEKNVDMRLAANIPDAAEMQADEQADCFSPRAGHARRIPGP